MLKVDPKDRAAAGQVNFELCQMIGEGETNAMYYMPRNDRTLYASVAKPSLSDAQKSISSMVSLSPSVGQPLPTS